MIPLFAIFDAPMQMLVVGLIVLLLFGNRLPGVMRSLGRGVTEFKKGIEGIEDDTSASPKNAEPKKIEEQATKKIDEQVTKG
jgi:sec-independent protein translocase protein TatA